jgi:hypothetical protein
MGKREISSDEDVKIYVFIRKSGRTSLFLVLFFSFLFFLMGRRKIARDDDLMCHVKSRKVTRAPIFQYF